MNTIITSDGLHLAGKVSGYGRPLVLIHDDITDMRLFDRLVSVLQDEWRIVRFDRRGSGSSEHSDASEYDPVDDLRCVFDSAGFDCAHVLGVGDAGVTALEASIALPGRVMSVILVNGAIPGYRPPNWERRTQSLLFRSYADVAESIEHMRIGAETDDDVWQFASAIVGGTRVPIDLRPELLSIVASNVRRKVPIWQGRRSASRARRRIFNADDLRSVPIPVTAVAVDTSDQETLVHDHASALAQAVPRGRYVSVESPAQGMLVYVKADLLARLLREHLEWTSTRKG